MLNKDIYIFFLFGKFVMREICREIARYQRVKRDSGPPPLCQPTQYCRLCFQPLAGWHELQLLYYKRLSRCFPCFVTLYKHYKYSGHKIFSLFTNSVIYKYSLLYIICMALRNSRQSALHFPPKA